MTDWTKEPSSSTAWGLDRSGSSTRRITENGYVRITEQGIIRIIDRANTAWSKETATVNPWTKE
jgi:hypothetical protein